MFYNIDVATNGLQERNWGGFGQVQSQLSGITGLINSTASSVNSNLAGNEWIMSEFKTMEMMNLQLW